MVNIMTNKYQKKRENPICDLARTLVLAKYHRTKFTSKMEEAFRGETLTFPCVIIEPIKALANLREESLSEKEMRKIARRIEDAKLPTLNKFLLAQERVELVSEKDTTIINQLIGEIKNEIIMLDTKAAKRIARKAPQRE